MAGDAQGGGEEDSAPVVPLGLGHVKMLFFTHAILERMSLPPPGAADTVSRVMWWQRALPIVACTPCVPLGATVVGGAPRGACAVATPSLAGRTWPLKQSRRNHAAMEGTESPRRNPKSWWDAAS